MSLTVKQVGAVVVVTCGTEHVVVGGKVLVGPWDGELSEDPTPTPVSSKPDLPPPSSGGVSIACMFPKTDAEWSEEIALRLKSLISGQQFKRLAQNVKQPLVVVLEPSDFRTFNATKRQITGAPIDMSSILFMSKYLKMD